ncbi:MAG: hypothetical protein V2I25_10800 [Woeseiaceae bacterium]|jgi:hypothetical protein|nr:hypothetical protein [Woeseiaceae bacterium]
MNRQSLLIGIALFSLGLLAGIAGTAIWAISKQDEYANRLIASSKAQNSVLLSGLVTLSNESDLDLFRGLARQALRANIFDLGLYLEHRTPGEQDKLAIETTLRGIAHRRDRLQLGAYAEVPNDISERIESILAKYDSPTN